MAGDREPVGKNQTETSRNTGPDQAILFIAASEIDSNLYYASRFLSGDPIVYLEFQGKRILLPSELEVGRARLEARVDHVESILPYENRLRESGTLPKLLDILEVYFREKGIRQLLVPANFPVAHADRLRAKGFQLDFRDEPFYPERTVKSEEEVRNIAAAQSVAEEAISLAMDTIRKSRISGDILELGGEPLTAERLRKEIHLFLLNRDYHAQHTIIAGGDQACDPHVRGSGPLPAHRPIVIDIFPRSSRTRYWGDITRTVIRGKPSPEVLKLHRDVLEAQELGLSLLRDGAEGMDIHQAVEDFFKERGRVTEERNGRMEGFIHSTGHGIGLDIHELPKIGRLKSSLQAGNVVTIEPGLYYPALGAVRIEDVAAVTPTGHKNLTRLPKDPVL